MKKLRWQGAVVFLMLGALLLLLGLGQQDPAEKIGYSAFWDLARQGEILSVEMGEGENWLAETRDGRRLTAPNPRAADGKERLLALGVEVRETGGGVPSAALAAVAVGAVLLLSMRGGRSAAGLKQFAAVQADGRVPSVTFADVAVSEDTLRSMQDLVAFLQSPQRFIQYGARFPKGVLLYGPPGTGKTLLARALAGEAKRAFFAMSGADFVQVYVGVGASRVRELFKTARKAGGGVIFIDEIDAIGKTRDNGNDEREQTLNALLTEMSGFSESEGIIVLAATNRLDTLDAALLREGRFDRRIEVGLPDYDERLKILRVHARGKPLADGVSLEGLARRTALFSGAQLETLLNEAAIRAARQGKEKIGEAEIEEAFCAVTVGDQRPGRMTEEEKRIASYHEAGHAVATHFLLPDRRIFRVTVIPSSRGAAGYVMSEQPDRLLHTQSELQALISTALAGRAAEEMILGKDNVTTGAASDLKKAREIARAMASDFAMGETGRTEDDQKAIFNAAFDGARACLRDHREQLDRLARTLMDRETLTEEEVLSLLEA